jgi:hypothetical protein
LRRRFSAGAAAVLPRLLRAAPRSARHRDSAASTPRFLFYSAIEVSLCWPACRADIGARDRRMKEDAPDPALHFGNLISAYADTIRTSDFKANLVVLFVAIMMGPIVANRDKYPHFLPLPVVLAPFLIAFLSLLFCVFPRYPRKGRNNFLVTRNPSKNDFVFVKDNVDDLEQLKLRCSILSQILYWKTLFLLISIYICLATIVIIFVLLSYALL